METGIGKEINIEIEIQMWIWCKENSFQDKKSKWNVTIGLDILTQSDADTMRHRQNEMQPSRAPRDLRFVLQSNRKPAPHFVKGVLHHFETASLSDQVSKIWAFEDLESVSIGGFVL